jgi:hypothetical protein
MAVRFGKNKNAKPKTSDLLAKVQKRAYELYTKRGFSHGNDMADWLEAERQIKRESGR